MTTDDQLAHPRGTAEAIACWQRLDADDRRIVARIAPDLAAALDAAVQ